MSEPRLGPQALSLVSSMVAVAVGGLAGFLEDLALEQADGGPRPGALPPLGPAVPPETGDALLRVAAALSAQRRALLELARDLVEPEERTGRKEDTSDVEPD